MIRKAFAAVLGLAALFYSLVYADLALRARSAYSEGEKYMHWAADPALKRAYYDARLAEEHSRLDREKAAGRMDDLEYRERLVLAQFEHDDSVSESSLKYAYHWYQTAVELFSTHSRWVPETRWARLSREKMPEAKRLWRQELDAAHIPYQDYMLE